MKHLTLSDIKIEKPDFSTLKENKSDVIVKWLIDWIKHSLEYGIADIGDFIPSKEDLASFLNVSTATIQNSIREVKNLGYFASKQSLGTYIVDFYSKDIKQDELYQGNMAQCLIKKIIIEENIEINSPILSIKEFSARTDISQNTIRFALNNLALKGFLEKVKGKGNKYHWIYKKQLKLSEEESLSGVEFSDFTLTNQLVQKIKKHLLKTYKTGEKILPNQAFARMFDVSIKTINDAMKVLNSKKIIHSRRGRYGTIFLGEQNLKTTFISSERKKLNSTFNYSWQKALSHLKKHIIENYEVGDKIDSIRQLALILNISPNTVRRALKEFFDNGYLISKRGKSGGIFIIDMPEKDEESYRWLVLNPDVVDFN